jgi:hypothetical protein
MATEQQRLLEEAQEHRPHDCALQRERRVWEDEKRKGNYHEVDPSRAPKDGE